MSKQREKKVMDTSEYTKEDAEDIMSTMGVAYSKLKGVESEMELEIATIRNKYQSKIDKYSAIKQEAVDKLYRFAETNPEFFVTKKSLELSHGKIGYRTSPPKLKLLKAFNWDRVVEKLEDCLPDFVRTKKEADKDKLLASREDSDISEKFKLVGIEVVHEETFYAEPKQEVVL